MQIYLKYVLFHGWKHIDKSEFPKNETYANGVPFYCLDSKTNDRVHYMCVKIEHLIEPEKASVYIEESATKTLKAHLKEYPIAYIEYLSKQIVSDLLQK